EKQPTGPGPEGCDENGPAAALFVGHVSLQICSLLTPCRRPILIATKYLVFRGQDTRLASNRRICWLTFAGLRILSLSAIQSWLTVVERAIAQAYSSSKAQIK
ncbi:MAG TPA: hypothetical protein VE860_10905, partial [Chthoniobacterales bacterium]|nr:hypothetical protein [Chthoniobacterales bacterium]